MYQRPDPAGGPHRRRHKSSKGFTLLELLVVVAIIGILAAISIPVYNNYIDKARVTVAIGTLDTIRKTLEGFHIDFQRYPQGIVFATGKENPGGETIFSPILIEQIGNDIIVTDADYLYNSTTLTYTLTARARNRQQTVLTMTPQATTRAP